MTSANVTEYRIELDGKVVGNHRQHHLCHTHWHRLLKFVPLNKHTIIPYGLDEHEAPWEGETQNLFEFIKSKGFSIGDMKRIAEYAELQREVLKEWVAQYKFHECRDPDLWQKTQKLILYSPL